MPSGGKKDIFEMGDFIGGDEIDERFRDGLLDLGDSSFCLEVLIEFDRGPSNVSEPSK